MINMTCQRCGYRWDAKGHTGADVCPECGEGYGLPTAEPFVEVSGKRYTVTVRDGVYHHTRGIRKLVAGGVYRPTVLSKAANRRALELSEGRRVMGVKQPDEMYVAHFGQCYVITGVPKGSDAAVRAAVPTAMPRLLAGNPWGRRVFTFQQLIAALGQPE